MLLWARILLPLVLVSTGFSQTAIPARLPNGNVGVPYETQLADAVIAQLPPEARLVSINMSAPNVLPGGLALAPAGRLSGVPTAAGNFNFSVSGRVTVLANNANFSSPFTIQANLIIEGRTGGFTIATSAIGFAAVSGAPARSVVRVLSNTGSTARPFAASVRSNGSWLSVSPAAGRVAGFSQTAITITANPARLNPGLHSGAVTITATEPTERFEIPVTLSVADPAQTISISQNGLSFEVEQGQLAPPVQTFVIATTSRTPEEFTITASTSQATGATPWLSVTPAAGSVSLERPVRVSVRADPARLAQGQYYGHLEISSGRNASRFVAVLLNVLNPNSNPLPSISPTGVILIQRPFLTAPPQTVTLHNPFGRALTATLATEFDGSTQNWFTVSSPAITVGAGQSVDFRIARSDTVRLSAGVHRGAVSVRAGNVIRRIAVLAIVLPGSENLITRERSLSAEACIPASLEAVSVTLAQGFSTATGWPIAMRALVVNNCGEPLVDGTVTAAFNTGDPPLNLTSEGDGLWAGTWLPRSSAANAVIHLLAASPTLSGSWQFGGSVEANASAGPLIDEDGVQSAASQVPGRRIAPGSFIAIRGRRIGAGFNVGSAPYPNTLGQATVYVSGGLRVPLYFVSEELITGVVPYNLPVTSGKAFLILERGGQRSQPVDVDVTPTQPAVFTLSADGRGIGIFQRFRDGVGPVAVNRTLPVRAGDVITIYCTGLGPLTNPLGAGTATPLPPPLFETRSPVTVTIGGRTAVPSFAGMVPTLAGLYAVNVEVPAGLARGEVEVVLTVEGESSPAVMLPVE